MLTKDPVVIASNENITRKMFLNRIQFPTPKSLGYRNTVSITAGAKRPEKITIIWVDSLKKKSLNSNWICYLPRLEKKIAPTSPMNGFNFGTAAEMPPRTIIVPPRIKICEMLCLSFDIFGEIFFHKISMGT